MPLTPIHVRGKKKAAAKLDAEASSSSRAPAGPVGARTEPKAPKKKSRETDSSRRVSNLEQLPVELLVMVFVESQNMDLLFCSRRLHEALNNHYSHVRVVAHAFAPTWAIATYHGRHQYEVLSRRDIVRRQEGLIRKMFFTIDLVLEAQQIWFDTYRPRNKRAHECETDVDCGGCDHCKGGVENVDFHFRECFEHDFKLAKASVKNRKVGWTHFRNRQDVELGVRLGPRILRGPWDEKHEKLIFWLVAGGAIIDHEKWDPQECFNIVSSHTEVSPQGKVTANSFFTYGANDLVSFAGWPAEETYPFYLRNKPPPGSDEWVPECQMLNLYMGGFGHVKRRLLRQMRRAAGRDVYDSDMPYDPDDDSGDGGSDSDW